MERCPTCGAAVRPGAKFCTSCGSRLDEQPTDTASETQDTAVATPTTQGESEVTPDPNWEAASGGAVEDETGNETAGPEDLPDITSSADTRDETASIEPDETWSGKWPEPRDTGESDNAPADRFRDEIDTEPETHQPAESPPAWSWREPDTTASSSWSADSDEAVTESKTITPETPVSSTGENDDSTEDGDPRKRASELLDEIRGVIWQIGSGTQADDKGVLQDISRVRGETNDFSDLEPVIEAARENPRDIDTLRDLSQKSGRLHELLESHKRLVSTLEDALREH